MIYNLTKLVHKNCNFVLTIQPKSCIIKIQLKHCILYRKVMNIMNKRRFIEDIIEIRKEQKLTQAELAKRTGMSQQVLSKVERENSNPTLDTLMSIANAMNCDIKFVEKDKIIYLKTEKEWRDAKSHIIKDKERTEAHVEELQCAIDGNLNGYRAESAKRRLKYSKTKLSELSHTIENYKTGTLAQLYRNIKNTADEDGFDEDDADQEIKDFEKHISSVKENVNTIKGHLDVSSDLFQCIEACKDLCAILDNREQIIDVAVLKEIESIFNTAKDRIDDLYFACDDIASDMGEIVSITEDNL